ncbi:hypothetical protein [Marinimicrobium sp. ABcell2]|uniref:DUF7931 domain-containing protein n=1 Tax=Marinimicrobium sp. ABcell2 TaxID=3069751 RepID=UPI0027AF6C0C|nr:hypothetical protein [Marinimicrobium sp. ABcell2]MDQ2075421.1 hypothetical protein [Marinimicrobium sp. ABcell2]
MSKVSAVSDDLLLLDCLEDFQTYTADLCTTARRHLDILSHSLDPSVYEHQDSVAAISALARAHRLARVRILVRDTQPLIERGHPLVRLAQRLPTKIELRKQVVEPENTDMAFLLADQERVLYKNDDREYRGFVNFQAPAEVRSLREAFTRAWENAEADPHLQRLHL